MKFLLLFILSAIEYTRNIPIKSMVSPPGMNYETCINWLNKYPNLKLNCSYLKTNNTIDHNQTTTSPTMKTTSNPSPNTFPQKENAYILSAYSAYKSKVMDEYNKYKNDTEYTEFLSLLQTKLKKERVKKALPPRFQQPEKEKTRNFTDLLNREVRNEITQDFLNTISSNSWVNKIKKQYKEFKDGDNENLWKHVDGFYYAKDNNFWKEENAKIAASRLYSSINNYINRHLKDYKQSGILKPDGSIENKPGDYINNDYLKNREQYKFNEDKQVSRDDLERLVFWGKK